MKSPSNPIRRRNPSAFTLIELLVVIIIIAALAALVVPNVGMFSRSTDMAVSAKSQADVANNVQQFFILQKRYPQGFDSLLDTTGAVYASDRRAACPTAVRTAPDCRLRSSPRRSPTRREPNMPAR